VAGELFAEMERAARHQLELEGFQPAQQKLLHSLDLRYKSQAFELNVDLGEGGAAEPGPCGGSPKAAGEGYQSPAAAIDAARGGRRPIWFDGAAHDCPVWERER